MHKRVCVPRPERGVYWAMATKRGQPMLFAVDSVGDEVKRVVLQDDSWARGEAAVEFLWRYLEMVDPRPQISLVKESSLPSTSLRVRTESAQAEYDPYNTPALPSMRVPRPW